MNDMKRHKKQISKETITKFKEAIAKNDLEEVSIMTTEIKSLTNRTFVTGGDHLDAKDPQGQWTPLLWAIQNNSADVVDVLLHNGAKVDGVGWLENSRMKAAHTPLSLACILGREQILRRLLESNVDVNEVFPGGLLAEEEGGSMEVGGHASALHYSVEHRNIPLTEILLEFGACVNKTDERGDTPLHVACERYSLSVIKVLVQWGSYGNQVNNLGLSPLGCLCECCQMVDGCLNKNISDLTRYLLAAGYRLNTDSWFNKNKKKLQGQSYLSDIFKLLSQPFSLQHYCRCAIRHCLFEKQPPCKPKVIEMLGLPAKLCSYLSLNPVQCS